MIIKEQITLDYFLQTLFDKNNFIRENKHYKLTINIPIQIKEKIYFIITAVRSRIKNDELLKISKNHKLYMSIYYQGLGAKSLFIDIVKIINVNRTIDINLNPSELVNIINTTLKIIELKTYL